MEKDEESSVLLPVSTHFVSGSGFIEQLIATTINKENSVTKCYLFIVAAINYSMKPEQSELIPVKERY